MNQTLPIALTTASAREQRKPLFLEQAEEDNEYTGKITKSVLTEKLLSLARPGQGYVVGNYCGGQSNKIERTVFVYLYDQQLNYRIEASYGTLSSRVVDPISFEQDIECGLNDTVDFRYPSEGLLSWEWITETRDTLGNIVEEPEVTVLQNGIALSKQVYGTLRVKYKVVRHRYKIAITSRAQFDEGVIKNKYSSTVYAVWAGGVDWEVLDLPYNYDFHNGDCKDIGYNVSIGPDGDSAGDDDIDGGGYTPPKASGSDKNIDYNYCTQLTDDLDDGRRCRDGRSMHEY